MKNYQKNSIAVNGKTAGAVFSLTAFCIMLISCVFSITVTAIAKSRDISVTDIQNYDIYKHFSYFASSLALILAILSVKLKYKQNPLKVAKINKFNPAFFAVVVLVSFGMLFGLSNINNLFVDFLKKIGYQPPENTLPSLSFFNVFISTIVICVLPAVLEEIIFRGIITQKLQKCYGTIFVLLMGGLIFSLYHMNPQQTIYQFIVGVLFSFITLKSDSVVPTIIIHFINNAVIVYTNYFFPIKFSGLALYLSTILGLVCLAVGVWICFVIDKFAKKEKSYLVSESKSEFISTAWAGLVICTLMWITNLISYILV